jgi:ABC-type sugar transport system ATPase subunit
MGVAAAPNDAGPGSRTVLEAVGLSKSYGGQAALDGASLSIRAGEVHGLVGENGAGKSTLIKILAGSVRRDGGAVSVDGELAEIRDERAAEQLGLHFVHQDVGLVDRLTVAENIYLGRELGGRGWTYSASETQRRAKNVLERFEDVDPGQKVAALSVAERWMVAIARACDGAARVIVMDEPTVALSDTEVSRVFEAIARLKMEGIAVVFVTHRLSEVLAICDRVTVMKDGRTVGTHPVHGLAREQLVRLIVGEMHVEVDGSQPVAASRGEVILRAEGISGGPLKGVSLDIRAGEVLGIAGLVGSGRSSLVRTLFGAERPSAGNIELDGKRLRLRHPASAIKAGIAMIPEERRVEGLLMLRSIRENTVLAHLPRTRVMAGVPIPSRRREDAVTRTEISDLAIKARGPAQLVGLLSGGNQQKVLLSRWLVGSNLRVLLLDEPTKGIDVGAKGELFAIIRRLAAKGVAVVFVSSDLDEVARACDRVVVLSEGRLVAELYQPTTEAEILEVCYRADVREVPA